MDRWKEDFVQGLRKGMPPSACAQTYAGLPLSKVHELRERDPEFQAAWNAALEPEDVSDGITSTRVLSPGALEPILWAQVPDKLVAAYFGLDEKVLLERINQNPKLKKVYDTARDGGKAAIHRAQFDAAMAGDREMLKWLGKQYLEQAEKVDASTSMPGAIGAPVTINQVILRALTNDQLEMILNGAAELGHDLVIEGKAEVVPAE